VILDSQGVRPGSVEVLGEAGRAVERVGWRQIAVDRHMMPTQRGGRVGTLAAQRPPHIKGRLRMELDQNR
jgi:hypothetical protein